MAEVVYRSTGAKKQMAWVLLRRYLEAWNRYDLDLADCGFAVRALRLPRAPTFSEVFEVIARFVEGSPGHYRCWRC